MAPQNGLTGDRERPRPPVADGAPPRRVAIDDESQSSASAAAFGPDRIQLLEIVQRSPSFLCVLRGQDHVIEFANEACLRLMGRRDVVGTCILDALPNARGQGLGAVLDHVLSTGEPSAGRQMHVRFAPAPRTAAEERYIEFDFRALSGADGMRSGVLAHGDDVTDQVNLRHEVERLLADSRQSRDALANAHNDLQRQHAELETANQHLQENATELEAQTEEIEVAMQDLAERALEADLSNHRAQFAGDVGVAITRGGELPEVMQRCCQAAVDHLDAAFARVWVLDPSEPVLVLTASAGLYTHLNGAHGRVPVGAFKIGEIASERLPHRTNAVLGDSRVPEQEWARREGMVSFAGYPLVVEGELLGVIAMFARRPLADADFAALESAATAISVTVAGRRRLDEAQRARTEAEDANRVKMVFLSTMSHELRTPLNAITGYAQLLEDGIRGPTTPAQRADLTRINVAAHHLRGLINDVLEYARIEAGHAKFDIRRVSLGAVITDVQLLVAPLARAAGVAIVVEGEPADGHAARADPDKLRQILLNLLTNAIKFTAAGGRITIDRQSDVARVRVRVTDTGRGIPDDQLHAIFEPFVQIDRDATRASQQGVGLGLAISRELARGMDGELTVRSRVGEGSTFTLTVPAST